MHDRTDTMTVAPSTAPTTHRTSALQPMPHPTRPEYAWAAISLASVVVLVELAFLAR